jgi:hypothetical protein
VTRAAAWAAAAVTLALAACHRADSTLLVEVTGDADLEASSLHTTVSADTRSWPGELSGTPIVFPAGLEVELPRDVVGPVDVSVDALDADGQLLASGRTMQAHIDTGGNTVVVVTLQR